MIKMTKKGVNSTSLIMKNAFLQALVEHSPSMNLVMYVFDLPDDSLESLFTSYLPVTHLYFSDSLPKKVLARIGEMRSRDWPIFFADRRGLIVYRQALSASEGTGGRRQRQHDDN